MAEATDRQIYDFAFTINPSCVGKLLLGDAYNRASTALFWRGRSALCLILVQICTQNLYRQR
jgi:hypothetical protein